MIANPWMLWSLNMRAARMAAETLDASAKVISHRADILCSAVRNPLAADYPEILRMVSEKVQAFAAAGQSVATDWSALQRMWLEQVQQMNAVGAAAFTGIAKGTRTASRSPQLSEHASRSMMRALTPIHSAATANARRLRRKKP